jgi:GNAT superfamily N-acetyltransferase
MESMAACLWRLAGEAVALYFRGAPEGEARLTPTAWLALSGEPVGDFNYALVDRGPEAADRLCEYARRIAARALPATVFLPGRVADELAPVARDLGLQHAGAVPLMTYQPDGRRPAATTYRVEQVADEAGLRAANRVLADAFAIPLAATDRAVGPELLDGPGWALFLARQDSGPVSTVATIRTGNTVGIWSMGTVPEQQRRGAGRALLEGVIARHRQMGAATFYLLATEAGKPLYRSIGFRTLDEAAVWVLGHAAEVPAH